MPSPSLSPSRFPALQTQGHHTQAQTQTQTQAQAQEQEAGVLRKVRHEGDRCAKCGRNYAVRNDLCSPCGRLEGAPRVLSNHVRDVRARNRYATDPEYRERVRARARQQAQAKKEARRRGEARPTERENQLRRVRQRLATATNYQRTVECNARHRATSPQRARANERNRAWRRQKKQEADAQLQEDLAEYQRDVDAGLTSKPSYVMKDNVAAHLRRAERSANAEARRQRNRAAQDQDQGGSVIRSSMALEIGGPVQTFVHCQAVDRSGAGDADRRFAFKAAIRNAQRKAQRQVAADPVVQERRRPRPSTCMPVLENPDQLTI